MKYPATMKRLEPLLESVKTAPMDESFKSDTSLLVTECLIRAIEARTAGAKQDTGSGALAGGREFSPSRDSS